MRASQWVKLDLDWFALSPDRLRDYLRNHIIIHDSMQKGGEQVGDKGLIFPIITANFAFIWQKHAVDSLKNDKDLL